ncbi:MAG: hypothetical protein ABI435_04800 [Pseudolysinimonas sp.]
MWYPSAHRFPGGQYPVDRPISLYSSMSGDQFTVFGADIEEMQAVVSHARYRGFDVTIGPIWAGAKRPKFDEVGGFVRGAIASGDGDYYATLLYSGPEGRAVLEIPGAQTLEGWPVSYEQIDLTAPLVDLEDYFEETMTMTPLGAS